MTILGMSAGTRLAHSHERERNKAIIRKLEPREHGAYRDLRLECLRLNPHLFGTTYEEAAATTALPFERHIWKRDSDHVMFGAFIDDVLVGICGFSRDRRERARHRGELVQLYVVPQASKQGIGTRLISTVLDYALVDPTVQQVTLSVSGDNDPALKVYHRAGFREYGWLEGYYHADGEDISQLFMVYERLEVTIAHTG
jgi:RimJ/RimL family protein N-acetyltransferase